MRTALHRPEDKPQQRGFTLIEVLIALVLIAVPLATISQSFNQYAKDSAYLKQKTLAHWVAMNKLTELQVQRVFPDTGRDDGETLMAKQSWNWQYEVSNTPDPDLRRVDIQVFAVGSKTDTITQLTAYLGK